jgi:hypothetical protein
VGLPPVFLDTKAEVDAVGGEGTGGHYDPIENLIAVPYDVAPFRGGISAFRALPYGGDPGWNDNGLLALNIVVHELFHFLLPLEDHKLAQWDPESAEKHSTRYPMGSPYDFTSCDVVNAAANAFTWAFVTRTGLVADLEGEARVTGAAGGRGPVGALEQSFISSPGADEGSQDVQWLWDFPGRLKRLEFVIEGSQR